MGNDVKLEVFKQHSRSWRDGRYVYPVISRRSRGLSIGVNLNPDTSCNFDCVYCCVDRTNLRPAPPVDLAVLGRELDEMLAAVADGSLFRVAPFADIPDSLKRLNDVAFSGDGEPTASPVFPEACAMAAEALARRGLATVKLVLITNATLLHRPKVAETLKVFDRANGELWLKLDAGTEAYYHLIERTRVPLRRVLENIGDAGRSRAVVIQSMFLRYRGAPPPAEEIEAYAARLRELRDGGCRIKGVHLYTVARRTAEAGVGPLVDAELDAIAERLRPLGLNVETFYSPA